MRIRQAALLALVCCAATCGGGSGPTSPEAPAASQPTPPPPSDWSIAGTVVSSLTAAPVSGATLAVGGRTLTTDAQGRWTLSGTGQIAATLAAEISAPGHITRHATIRGANGRADVRIDLFRDASPFSLEFYRELVRDSLEASTLEPLLRWTSNPSVYVDIRNPKGGVLSASEVDLIHRAAAEAITAFSGGALSLARFESGAAARGEQDGWINVEIIHDPAADYCGEATVGANPGVVVINYDSCTCNGQKFSASTVAHEFGHALGFYHVADEASLMYYADGEVCDTATPSARERHHGALAYTRPNGSTDIDRDGATQLFGPPREPRWITCRR